MPDWWGGVAWNDPAGDAMWRADETSLLPAPPLQPTGIVTADPRLPDEWWTALNASLDVLAVHRTTRVATPDTVVISQAHVTEVVRTAFGASVDTAISTWTSAHADLHWTNVTAHPFCLFDWEDWGRAPRGLDAASLWSSSLGVPALADRVRRERRRDLDSRDGKIMMLFCCAKIVGPHAHPADPRLAGARAESARLVTELQQG
ncbi:hypothetical protein BTM25_06370 [Actinomadura rubteroloni]|uniref:Phosphotransferase n=1 Tax=Actinomadura rubteroloni TaxID=1926885 RepID=A0A2P4UMG7_9ACTN|nr:hypothetical protein [Actinomadura rubteroloni]POM26243.1 hypothetical protein BTM25_06370 [Actinomadura rubteroloni]